MSSLRAVILDFDGVILESNGLKTAAFESVFGRFPEHADAMIAYHHAHVSESRFAKFTHLVTERLGRPAGDPLIVQLGEAFSAEMIRRIADCPMVPGAGRFLDAFAGRVPLYVSSMTPQDELLSILARRGLAEIFDGVYGYPPWPKAEAIQEIVSRLGSSAGVLFVGDSAADQRAAREAGVEFLARDCGLAFEHPRPRSFPDLDSLCSAIVDRLPSPGQM